MSPRLLAVLVLLLAGLLTVPASAAGPEECPDPTVSLLQVSATCEWSLGQYDSITASEDHVWITDLVCETGSAARCDVYLTCTVNGETAFMHQIYMDGIPVGQVCLPKERELVDIARVAIREFTRIAWPASALVVQPPGGKTLVNFDTNFYTENDQPITRTVNAAGRQVEIRATPVAYTFRFGDGAVLETASPGRPNPYLDVTHAYKQADRVKVALDTTYAGEYRIDDGEWRTIDATVSVPGAAQDLDVVEALPQLVIR